MHPALEIVDTTPAVIIFRPVVLGMLIGVLLATFSFVVTYARLQTVSAASLKSSTVIRTFEERAVLIANRFAFMKIRFFFLL